MCKTKGGGGGAGGGKEEQMFIRSTDSSSPLFNMSLVIVASYLKKPVWGCRGMTSLNHESFNRLSVQLCVCVSLSVTHTHTHKKGWYNATVSPCKLSSDVRTLL